MIKRLSLSLFSIAALALALSGCGGGSVDVGVTVPVAPPPADFDVTAMINGAPLANLDVFPGESQTVSVVAGDAFELDTNGPVFWDFSAGGSADIPATPGATVVYGGASLNEAAVGDTHLVLSTASTAPAGSSIPITIYVTSQRDSSQVATIDLLVTN
ncbi:MAG TPA: hypothetical protein VIN06_03945 [Devosia sp.]